MKLIASRLALFGLLVGAYLVNPIAGVLALTSGFAYGIWQRKRHVSVRS